VYCTISKSTLEEIPKRICIDIDLRPSYEHYWVKIGDSSCCVKVCHLVCFYVGISGKLLEVFSRELKKRAFDVPTLDGSRYIYILIYPHIWGIIGREMEWAFIYILSEFTNNGYSNIYRQYRKWQTLIAFKCSKKSGRHSHNCGYSYSYD
jgi:hypothetical protein